MQAVALTLYQSKYYTLWMTRLHTIEMFQTT
jgi:hypothetical protein